jgi:hypothetical protein
MYVGLSQADRRPRLIAFSKLDFNLCRELYGRVNPLARSNPLLYPHNNILPRSSFNNFLTTPYKHHHFPLRSALVTEHLKGVTF